jgi:hypothetical protein
VVECPNGLQYMRLQTYITEASIDAAFFISPYGDIITADISHIDTVIKYPKKFGVTKEYIERIYNKYNEKLGVEGKAREEILKELMSKGWVRIRRYPNRFWSVQVNKITKKVKDYLYDWSKRILKGIGGFREQDKHIPVKIVPLTSSSYADVKMIPVDKIASDALYNESEIHLNRDVLTERTIDELNDIEQYTLSESGYSRLMRIMSGLVPSVKTFAIITWENPMGKRATSTFNKKANNVLNSMLKKCNFSYKQIRGKYGDYENPYIIFNIDLNTAKNIGFKHVKYKQESIIYGIRYSENKEEGMIYRMIYSDNRPSQERRVWMSLDRDEEDFYSEYKGRKFQIPFFDDNFVGKMLKNGKVVNEHNIYREEDFDDAAIEKLNEMVDVLLDEQRSGYSLYIHRGELHTKLLEYKGC